MKLNTERWVFSMRIIRDPHQAPLQISVIILQFWLIVNVLWSFLVVKCYQDLAKWIEVFLDIEKVFFLTVVLKKRCTKIFTKFTGEQSCVSVIFVEFALLHGCSPVNLLYISRTSLYKCTYRGLLLH